MEAWRLFVKQEHRQLQTNRYNNATLGWSASGLHHFNLMCTVWEEAIGNLGQERQMQAEANKEAAPSRDNNNATPRRREYNPRPHESQATITSNEAMTLRQGFGAEDNLYEVAFLVLTELLDEWKQNWHKKKDPKPIPVTAQEKIATKLIGLMERSPHIPKSIRHQAARQEYL